LDIRLDYGEKSINVKIDEKRLFHIIENEPIEPVDNIEEKLLDGFRRPIGSLSLKKLIDGKKNICIVISDSTRAAQQTLFSVYYCPRSKVMGFQRNLTSKPK